MNESDHHNDADEPVCYEETDAEWNRDQQQLDVDFYDGHSDDLVEEVDQEASNEYYEEEVDDEGFVPEEHIDEDIHFKLWKTKQELESKSGFGIEGDDVLPTDQTADNNRATEEWDTHQDHDAEQGAISKAQTADQSQRRRRRLVFFVAATMLSWCVVGGILGAAIVIVVLENDSDDSHSDQRTPVQNDPVPTPAQQVPNPTVVQPSQPTRMPVRVVAPAPDAGKITATRFPHGKDFIDQVCHRNSISGDGGARCRDACEPQFSECCNPFKTDGVDCSFDKDASGCMRYAKCQTLDLQVDSAPSTLPVYCSQTRLDEDPVSCQELCKPVRCCFSAEKNCMVENFNVCMDYAPCQNLRKCLILETAPNSLDAMCRSQSQKCIDTCNVSECCRASGESSCFQENVLACLTYAACDDINDSTMVTPQFSVVEKPSNAVATACTQSDQNAPGVSCTDMCEEAACCWTDASTNNSCFLKDPLGCLAWEQQCGVVFDSPPSTSCTSTTTTTWRNVPFP